MARLILLTIDTEETIRLAVELRAAQNGLSLSDVVNAILREALTAEITEASSGSSLAAVIQDLHERRSRLANNGSHRPDFVPL